MADADALPIQNVATAILRGLNRLLDWAHSHSNATARETACAKRALQCVDAVSESLWRNRHRLPYSWPVLVDDDEEEPVVTLVLLFMHCKHHTL